MIKINGACLKFRDFSLENISLDIETGDYFMLVGPTGSGKTLLLETIAGLHSLHSGTILLDHEDITNWRPEKRNISIVYQDSALFPHLSIADNIMFGLKVRKINGRHAKERLNEMSALIGIENLLKRKPSNLSGGEKQKAALARSLIIEPRVLLLDEPLSALDPETRAGLQSVLKKIHQELDITFIHVTHDFEETLSMGKHAAVIGSGKIQQFGQPEKIFRKPNSEFVARFTMTRNIFRGKLDDGGMFNTGSIRLMTNTSDKANFACIRPDDITISNEISDSSNSFRGIITSIEDRGPIIYVTTNVPPEVCCMLTRNSYMNMNLFPGKTVSISLNSNFIHLFQG